MQRNVAQAIALGADFDTATFKSSVLPWNLHRLEQIARKLKPPVWPTEIFGAIDSARAERGKALYEKNCLQCHDRERLIALDRVERPRCGPAISPARSPSRLSAIRN